MGGSFFFFLIGPTATRKTAIAQWLAERHGLDILSADSMQVYRGMDVGTAKPTRAERARVRYWGLDLVSIGERFSVGDYRRVALEAVQAAENDGRPLIISGGTGLYIKSLLCGLRNEPVRLEEVREQGQRILAEQGVQGLQDWLAALNPQRLAALDDPKNPRRLLRAIELAAAGQAAKSITWQQQKQCVPGLYVPRDILRTQIVARTQKMYAAGLLEEVEKLAQQNLATAPTALQAIGYAEVLKYLAGSLTMPEAMAETVRRTHQLAKRQMTWFRHQISVDWIDAHPMRPVADVAQDVWNYWQTNGGVSVAC